MKWLFLLIGILCNTGAAVTIKLTLAQVNQLDSLTSIILLAKSYLFWISMIFYGSTFLFYALAMFYLPLSVAHPIFTSSAIVLVSLFSVFLLGESFYWTTLLGIMLVIVGVILITTKVN